LSDAPTEPVVIAALVFAALLHASWNAAAHHVSDREATMAWIGAVNAAVAAAFVPWVPVPDAGAWGFLLGSVVVQTAYALLLVRSFRLGAFGQVYPLARGLSPLVVAVVGVTVVGQRMGPGQGLGVAVLCAGLVVLVVGGGALRAERPAVVAAALTGLCIAGYTVLDGVGVRAADTTAGYLAWMFLLDGVALVAVLGIRRGPRLIADCRAAWRVGLVNGVVSMAAYGIAVWAQTRANLATVAALREVSILFGALIGLVLFRERFGRRRVAGAALVVAGIVLLNM
jgi:drug/metabolite transporter (DMT)-like permease